METYFCDMECYGSYGLFEEVVLRRVHVLLNFRWLLVVVLVNGRILGKRLV